MKEKKWKHCFKLSLAHILLFTITVYPLLSVDIAPLVDWPNHLARNFIIANIAKSPLLQQQYDVSFTFSPYMIMDSILSTIARFISIYAAGKLFILMTCAALVSCVLSLQLSLFKRVSYSSLLVYPFIYSAPMAWGFINYLFSSALAIIVFSLWLGKENSWSRVRKLIIFSFIAILLLLSHLYALALFGVLYFFYECQNKIFKNKFNLHQAFQLFLDSVIIFTPSLIVFTLLPKNNLLLQKTSYLNVLNYLQGLFSPLYYNTSSVKYIILFALILLIWFILLSSFRIARNMTWVLISLLIISLVMPVTVMGVFLVNYRTPLMFCLVFIGSIEFAANDSYLKLKSYNSLLLFLFCLISFIRLIGIYQDIHQCSCQFTEYRKASKIMQPGMPQLALNDSYTPGCGITQTYWHIQMLGVIENYIFSPDLFNHIKTYVSVNKPYSSINPRSAMPIPLSLFNSPPENIIKQKPFFSNWQKKFAYLLIFNSNSSDKPSFGNLQLIYHGSSFNIFKNTDYFHTRENNE